MNSYCSCTLFPPFIHSFIHVFHSISIHSPIHQLLLRQEYEPGRVGRDVMPLDSGLLEHNKQAKDVQQVRTHKSLAVLPMNPHGCLLVGWSFQCTCLYSYATYNKRPYSYATYNKLDNLRILFLTSAPMNDSTDCAFKCINCSFVLN